MKFLVDTHTHSIVSGHAYSTIEENAAEAYRKGLRMMAVTDHGPAIPGAPHAIYFGNLKVLPEEIRGVRILKGAEVNIINFEGELDLPDRILRRLDLVLASFHEFCLIPGDVEENTEALIRVMQNPLVDVIAHPGNPVYPIDIPRFVRCAKETGTLIEINNSSFGKTRAGSRCNCTEIILEAKRQGAYFAIGSDAHFSASVGDFEEVALLFEELHVPDNLVASADPERLMAFIGKKR